VALPAAKKDKYVERIQEALDMPRNFLSKRSFQGIHGKIQHATVCMPCMRGFMTPLNRVLATATTTVGLGKGSALRETLEEFIPMLELAHHQPTHITEIVPPDLPHYYGYVDFAAVGMGGVWLPCTRWLQPLVWREKCPSDIEREVRKQAGTVSNSDGEAAAYFAGELLLDHLIEDTAGVSTHLGSDNSPTVGWNQRGASRASHQAPERLLRWQAMRQRWTRRGPQDCDHVAGKDNRLGDFPSRWYEEGFPLDSDDAAFFAEFTNRHPLPPQLGCWQFVRLPPAIALAAFSILRNQYDTTIHPATCTGASGVGLPTMLANTLSSPICKAPTSTWNEATCSWPLLSPCGTVSSTKAAELQGRRSRKRYAGADSAWSPLDLRTLDAQMRDSKASTASFPPP